jgi:hypothetical protein
MSTPPPPPTATPTTTTTTTTTTTPTTPPTEYATSDLSARGVDTATFEACLRLPVKARAARGCGDFELTRGLLHLRAGADRGGFTVRVMDDLCRERFMVYAQLTLSVPGAAVITGEAVQAKLRIDDDDFTRDEC